MLSWQNKNTKNKVNNELLLRKQAEHEANIARKAEEEEKKKKAEAAVKESRGRKEKRS